MKLVICVYRFLKFAFWSFRCNTLLNLHYKCNNRSIEHGRLLKIGWITLGIKKYLSKWLNISISVRKSYGQTIQIHCAHQNIIVCILPPFITEFSYFHTYIDYGYIPTEISITMMKSLGRLKSHLTSHNTDIFSHYANI